MSSAALHRAEPIGVRVVVAMFLAFAFAYFFSALLRAVTATLATAFSAELGLSSGDLGLLAGAYFLGFSVMQLPLGRWLDRVGPRRVLLGFLCVAVAACAAFAQADSFVGLWVARALIGVGVSACLMAPMTAYRRHLGETAQLRANSWMLMTGSIGMLASTLPVQWLVPLVGWRGLFFGVAAMLVLAMLFIAIVVPRDRPAAQEAAPSAAPASYGSSSGAVRDQPVDALCLLRVGCADAASAAVGLDGGSAHRTGRAGVARPVGPGCDARARGAGGVVVTVVRVVHLCFAEPAGRRPGLPDRAGRAGVVGLQLGDLSRRVQRAVGHRPDDRCAGGPRLGACRRCERPSVCSGPPRRQPTSGSCCGAETHNRS